MGQIRTFRGKQINCLSSKYNLDNICTIFELLGKNNQPIPKHIVNKGCTYYLEEDADEHPLLRYAMKLFNAKLTK